MTGKSWLIVVAIALYSWSSIEAGCQREECFEATKWHAGYTAVVLDTDDLAVTHAARQAIERDGGHIAIVAGTRLLLGWVPPAAERLRGQHAITDIIRGRMLRRTVGRGRDPHANRQSERASAFFDEVISGRRADIVESALDTRGAPLVGDAGESAGPPTPSSSSGEGSWGGTLRVEVNTTRRTPPWPNESMTGTVIVNVFIVESDGSGTDPNTFTWTPAHWNEVINQVFSAYSFWSNEAAVRGRSVSFSPAIWEPYHARCNQRYEPILHTLAEHHLWVGQVMSRSGWPAANPMSENSVQDANEAFNEAERFKVGWTYDRSYSAFIVYNPPPASPFFTDGGQAFGFYGGPWVDVLFNSGGWGLSNLGLVLTHETGHVFWACDEYSGTENCGNCNQTCRTFGPRLTARNGNCASCNPFPQQCMMRTNDHALCGFTPAQVGW